MTIRPFITAFRTLTVIPLPGKDAENFSHSLFFFPFAGAFISICEYATMAIGVHFLPSYPNLIAFFMVLCGVLVTGAIHCDGLADFCDGFFGGKTRDQVLAIMKDPRTGSFGVIALIMDLGFRFILYQILISHKAFYIIIFSLVVSRLMQAFCAAFSHYARPEGGIAARFTGQNKSKYLVIASFALWYCIGSMYSGFVKAIVLFSCAMLSTVCMLLFCKKRIGGITGDCIGACSEMSENVILLCGLFVL